MRLCRLFALHPSTFHSNLTRCPFFVVRVLGVSLTTVSSITAISVYILTPLPNGNYESYSVYTFRLDVGHPDDRACYDRRSSCCACLTIQCPKPHEGQAYNSARSERLQLQAISCTSSASYSRPCHAFDRGILAPTLCSGPYQEWLLRVRAHLWSHARSSLLCSPEPCGWVSSRIGRLCRQRPQGHQYIAGRLDWTLARRNSRPLLGQLLGRRGQSEAVSGARRV